MPNELKDMHINRISLVKRPANARPFLMFKSEDDGGEDVEVMKAEDYVAMFKDLSDHVQAVLELTGASADQQDAAGRISDLINDGAESSLRRATDFVAAMLTLKGQLNAMVGHSSNAAEIMARKSEDAVEIVKAILAQTEDSLRRLDRMEHGESSGEEGATMTDSSKSAFEAEVDKRFNARVEKGAESTYKLRKQIIEQLAAEQPELYEAHRDFVAPKK